MANLTIPFGQYCTIVMAGNGSAGATPLLPGSSTVMLSSAEYANAYVVDLGPDAATGGEKIAIVPRASAPPPVGGSLTVTLQCAAKDKASGDPLTALALPVVLEGAMPAPPAATNIGFFSSAFLPIANAPADPGANEITF